MAVHNLPKVGARVRFPSLAHIFLYEYVKEVRFFGKNYFLLVFHFVRKPQKTVFPEKALPILLNVRLF